VVVPVALVSRVPVAVVDVVNVIFVRNGDVPAVGPVLVFMPLMCRVPRRPALVHVIFMHAVDVTVVDVVGVVAVRERDVPAAVTVNVRMVGVRAVLSCRGHSKSPVPGNALRHSHTAVRRRSPARPPCSS
jgi:hypothetical protein